MLKFKHLFDNPALAEMICRNWISTEDEAKTVKLFRISSNAIYTFQKDGKKIFCRFSNTEEKNADQTFAEIEYIKYLNLKGLKTAEPVLSSNGRLIETLNTPWGEYVACSFGEAEGVRLDKAELTDDVVFKYGKKLGEMHRYSADYKPCGIFRKDYTQILTWIEETLNKHDDNAKAISELGDVRSKLGELPRNERNFGLIHYDYELDNVFFDSGSETLKIIDFDDSMYMWYVTDIEQALDNLREEAGAGCFESYKAKFIAGYESEYKIDREIYENRALIFRFINIYGYSRIKRALSESWVNEPKWMSELRIYLQKALEKKTDFFKL